MSFSLNSISQGTNLYHGRGDQGPVEGMEWLAFEAEHVAIFATNMTRQLCPETQPL